MTMTTTIAPALQPWRPIGSFKEPTEELFADWLTANGIKSEPEAWLFPNLGASGRGFAPDAYIHRRESEWGAQFVEFTTGTTRRILKEKSARIRNAARLYPSLPVTLLLAGRATWRATDIPILYWDDIKDDPEKFRAHLRRLSPAIRQDDAA